jgi:hypothetical protein
MLYMVVFLLSDYVIVLLIIWRFVWLCCYVLLAPCEHTKLTVQCNEFVFSQIQW